MDIRRESKNNPLIGVVIGSDSDLPIMAPGLEILEKWGIPFEVHILSAHRTPTAAADYAQTARDRGLKVIIAGAGMAAHLPGVLAAYTTLPVVGVPIASGELKGVDALYAIVQMPSGVPVASVGINAGKNAVILAIEILGLTGSVWQDKLEAYRKDQAEGISVKNARLQELGYHKYLDSAK
ncbi:MAG: 5-(carboxyamino)imidazole ribonucleotide mutase [Firmicutes bacterium]|nr:5-(carboxyamino)imidazole ribonucleotide mutase [Bacillota bacterium]